jgi:hypothetical protein
MPHLCCCGISEANAYQWWDDHRVMFQKDNHTNFHNNKIKMIKQQFNGKLQQLGNMNVKHQVLTFVLHQFLTSLDRGRSKHSLHNHPTGNHNEMQPH